MTQFSLRFRVADTHFYSQSADFYVEKPFCRTMSRRRPFHSDKTNGSLDKRRALRALDRKDIGIQKPREECGEAGARPSRDAPVGDYGSRGAKLGAARERSTRKELPRGWLER